MSSVDMSRSRQDFAEAFKACEGSKNNFVLIADVQQQMVKLGYTKQQTIDTIQHGRRAGLLALDTSDGNHKSLTATQRDTGIKDGYTGSPYVYVSYRG